MKNKRNGLLEQKSTGYTEFCTTYNWTWQCEHINLMNSTTKTEEDRDEHNDGMYTMATTNERNVKRSLALALQLQQ